jgi:hypothetical protein
MRDIVDLCLAFVAGLIFGAAVVMFGVTPKTYVTTDPGFGIPLEFKAEMTFHAAPTVRPMVGSSGSCSAVVVAPGLALTAQHCKAVGDDMTVGGHAVASTRVYSKKDVMLLSVPGLVCPCATLGDAPAVVGEDVASIGYPMAIGQVVAIGLGQGHVIYNNEVYTLHTAYSGPGMSGGGLFVQRDGKAQLVALTSRGREGVFTMAVDVSWMQPKHLTVVK